MGRRKRGRIIGERKAINTDFEDKNVLVLWKGEEENSRQKEVHGHSGKEVGPYQQ